MVEQKRSCIAFKQLCWKFTGGNVNIAQGPG